MAHGMRRLGGRLPWEGALNAHLAPHADALQDLPATRRPSMTFSHLVCASRLSVYMCSEGARPLSINSLHMRMPCCTPKLVTASVFSRIGSIESRMNCGISSLESEAMRVMLSYD